MADFDCFVVVARSSLQAFDRWDAVMLLPYTTRWGLSVSALACLLISQPSPFSCRGCLSHRLDLSTELGRMHIACRLTVWVR